MILFEGNSMARTTLKADVVQELRRRLPEIAEHTVEAVRHDVPPFAAGVPTVGRNVEAAVAAALDEFLGRLHTSTRPSESSAPGLDAAYALGRGEAHSGRSIDVLLAAFRSGARASWLEMSVTLVERDVPTAVAADLAASLFEYIDGLSAASVAGHADELVKTGRVREQYREALGRALLDGEEPDRLAAKVERADWVPPETLTAVILPASQARTALLELDASTLLVAGAGETEEATVLLVPDVHRRRDALVASLRGRVATVGPARPWTDAATSHRRAVRAREVIERRGTEAIDADRHLVTLVVNADTTAAGDLRTEALAPLADLRPSTRDRLVETLRSWLLHQGRREAVAADLNIHAQTVRYRMTQLRELYGDALADPRVVEQIVVALASAAAPLPQQGDAARRASGR